jgi:hypothetical protein
MRGPHVRFCERREGAILRAYSTVAAVERGGLFMRQFVIHSPAVAAICTAVARPIPLGRFVVDRATRRMPDFSAGIAAAAFVWALGRRVAFAA